VIFFGGEGDKEFREIKEFREFSRLFITLTSLISLNSLISLISLKKRTHPGIVLNRTALGGVTNNL
jgi:hypothetical protein